jgi:hypothetical protein
MTICDAGMGGNPMPVVFLEVPCRFLEELQPVCRIYYL